jgi:Surface antigen variable number repeat
VTRRLDRPGAWLAVAVLCLFWVGPSAAQERDRTAPDRGRAAEERDRRRVMIADVNFTGVNAVRERDLAVVLATKASSSFPWGDRYYFSRAEFQADLKRIPAFYADRGYPRARVASYDIIREGREKVKVNFHIEEGPPVTLASVSLYGFDVLSHEAIDLLKSEMPLRVGAVTCLPRAIGPRASSRRWAIRMRACRCSKDRVPSPSR